MSRTFDELLHEFRFNLVKYLGCDELISIELGHRIYDCAKWQTLTKSSIYVSPPLPANPHEFQLEGVKIIRTTEFGPDISADVEGLEGFLKGET